MPKPKKVASKPIGVDIPAMRLEIGKLINSFGFSWYDGITESIARERTKQITQAIEKKFGKYFTVVEEISGPDSKPPFHSSWHIIEKK